MTDNAALYKALAAAQAEMEPARKGSNNPHFRSKYADLGAVQDACLPALHKHGFAVYQPMGHDEFGPYVETVFAHESGGVLTSRLHLKVDKANMQGLGSAITYARRYGLLAMAGIAPEDDDGNKAAETDRRPAQTPPPASKPAGTLTDPTAEKMRLLDDLEKCPDHHLVGWKGHYKDALNALKAADERLFNDVKSAWELRDRRAKEKAA